jgi:large subunit ribosomal protein L21
MYAIVEACGKQYRVAKGDTIQVDHLDADVGATVRLDRVLLLGGDSVVVGSPTVPGAVVTATVLDHPRGEKVTSLKYIRTRRFRRRHGFRATHTTLQIHDIQS